MFKTENISANTPQNSEGLIQSYARMPEKANSVSGA